MPHFALSAVCLLFSNYFRYPYATGVTLDKVQMKTISLTANNSSSENVKSFVKQVILESFAIYWKPKANLHSEDKNKNEDTIDLMFDANICTRDKPSTKLKYLLGPISSEAKLEWCPSPEKCDFKKPLVDLIIKMKELGKTRNQNLCPRITRQIVFA